jgi:putative Mg2+ transporter-C (MgtC) family protein
MASWLFTPWIEVDMVIRLVVSALVGGIIGFERERMEKPAGLRTYTLVSIGSCLFTLLSLFAFGSESDPGRVAANIVVGIGFLGAGTIIQAQGQVRGLTTAASIWAVSAIGMAFGTGMYLVGLVAAFLIIIVLRVLFKLRHSDK